MEDFTQSHNESMQSELFTKGFASAAAEQTLGNPMTVHTTGAIEFRVIRPGTPSRRLRLTGNRYTFGSGEGCSIRLEDPALRPMHAVLLRDAQRVLMRAYSVPLEYNGERVAETDLRVGDIIRMGDYRFELLTLPSDPAAAARSLSLPRSAAPPKNQFGPNNETLMRQRLTELSQQWHARHAECEIRETRCDNRETALHGRETELWQRVNDLQKRESKLVAQESAVREIQATYAAAQDELKSLREREKATGEELAEKEAELLRLQETLADRQAELEQKQDEWLKREEEYSQRSAEVQRQLEQTQSQAKSASDAIGRMRNEFASLNEQLSELRERHSELQQRERQEQETHERLRAELELNRDNAVIERDQAIEARAISEAARAAKETELDRSAKELENTRAKIEELRKESQARQQELEAKLRTSGEELAQARNDAKQAHQTSDQYRDQLSAAELKEAEFEQSISEFEAKAAEYQAELEAVRKQASEDQQAALLECEQTQSRIDELEKQLADLREANDDQQSSSDQQVTELKAKAESAEYEQLVAEETIVSLKQEIAELQESLSKAAEQASKWQNEFEGANASIRQLELLVDQNQNRQTAQQDSWEIESDQLQNTINELSVQLSGANTELAKLREANEALTRDLSDATAKSDEGSASTIDPQRFEDLENELRNAREDIERLKTDHAETVAKLETERQSSESALREEIQKLQDEISAAQHAAAQAAEMVALPQNADADVSVQTPSPNDWYTDQADSFDGAADAVTEESVGDDEAAYDEASASWSSDEQLRESEPIDPFADIDLESVEDEDEHEMPLAEAYHGRETDSIVNLDDISVNDEEQLVGEADSFSEEETESQYELETEAHLATEVETSSAEMVEDESVEDQQWRTDAAAEEGHEIPKASSWGYEESPVDEAASAESISWQDESPEQSVSDAIDDLEHHVQQAIDETERKESVAWDADQAASDFAHESSALESPEYEATEPEQQIEPPAEHLDEQFDEQLVEEEPIVEQSIERDQPLSWADFMPGEQSQFSTPDVEEPENAIDEVEQVAEEEIHASHWSSEESSSEADESYTSTQMWQPGEEAGGTEFDQPFGQQDNEPHEEPQDEPAIGSLAQMLIRDLDAEREHENASHQDFDESADSDHEPTMVMADRDELAESGGQWNFASSRDEYDRADERDERYDDQDDAQPLATSFDDNTDTAQLNAHQTLPSAEPSAEDDSIEAYMSRLLQRVQGGSTPAPMPAPIQPPAPAPALAAAAKAKPKVPNYDELDEDDSDSVVDLDEEAVAKSPAIHAEPLVPRSQAPELKKNLSAMRELANQSARNAVARSIRIQARDTQMNAIWKTALSASFVLMALGVFIFVSWSSTIKLVMVAAFLVLAGVFGQEAFVLARDARRRLKLANEGGEAGKNDAEIAEEMQRIAEETEAK